MQMESSLLPELWNYIIQNVEIGRVIECCVNKTLVLFVNKRIRKYYESFFMTVANNDCEQYNKILRFSKDFIEGMLPKDRVVNIIGDNYGLLDCLRKISLVKCDSLRFEEIDYLCCRRTKFFQSNDGFDNDRETNDTNKYTKSCVIVEINDAKDNDRVVGINTYLFENKSKYVSFYKRFNRIMMRLPDNIKGMVISSDKCYFPNDKVGIFDIHYIQLKPKLENIENVFTILWNKTYLKQFILAFTCKS